MNLATLPKVELHLHFAGTIAPALAGRLAQRHGAAVHDLGIDGGRYPARYRDLAAFLELYGRIDELVRAPDDVFEVASALAGVQAAQAVAWTEVITPIWPYLGRGIPAGELWDALAAGLASGGSEARFGILLEVLPDAVPGPEQLADAVSQGARRGLPVVGVGLMGVGPPEGRTRLAQDARAWRAIGLGLQVHAGETGPAENVDAAIELGANRIAHGITIVRVAAILERIVRDRVPLDLCPTSNVAITGIPTLQAHPIRELWRAGAVITISTDDPPFVGTNLEVELASIAALLGLDAREVLDLQRRALEVSFAPADVRLAIDARLDAWAAAA